MKIKIKNNNGYKAFLNFMDKLEKKEIDLNKREMDFINGSSLYRWKLNSIRIREENIYERELIVINGLKFSVRLENRFRVKGEYAPKVKGEVNEEYDFLPDPKRSLYDDSMGYEFKPHYVVNSFVGEYSDDNDEINVFSLNINKNIKLSKSDVIKVGDERENKIRGHDTEIICVRRFDINKTKGLYDENNINYCTKWIYYFIKKTCSERVKWFIFNLFIWFLTLSMISLSITLFKDMGFLNMYPYLVFISSFLFLRSGIRYKKRRRSIKMLKIKKELINFIGINIKPKIKGIERASNDNDFFDEHYDEKKEYTKKAVNSNDFGDIMFDKIFRIFRP